MRHVYIITEGVQDSTVGGKLLRLLVPGLTPISRRREVSAFWDRMIPFAFPGRNNDNEEVFGRMVVPDFFQNEDISVAIQNSGGLDKLATVLRSDFDGLPNLPDAIGIIIDADGKDVLTTHRTILTKIHAIRSDLAFGETPGSITPGPPKLGLFVLPNNQENGTLEDTMLECATTSYPQLLPIADTVIASVNSALDANIDWLSRPERDLFKKPYGQNKTRISVVGAIMKPTYAVQNTYREHNWITAETLVQPKLALLASFLRNLIT